MNARDRLLCGLHGFSLEWWIFSIEFTVKQSRDIISPRWLGLLLCKLNKHQWFTRENLAYKCMKCGKVVVV